MCNQAFRSSKHSVRKDMVDRNVSSASESQNNCTKLLLFHHSKCNIDNCKIAPMLQFNATARSKDSNITFTVRHLDINKPQN